jgi:hypothetical protein
MEKSHGVRLTKTEKALAAGAVALGGWMLARWLLKGTANRQATMGA